MQISISEPLVSHKGLLLSPRERPFPFTDAPFSSIQENFIKGIDTGVSERYIIDADCSIESQMEI
jgi:hypothetical protein